MPVCHKGTVLHWCMSSWPSCSNGCLDTLESCCEHPKTTASRNLLVFQSLAALELPEINHNKDMESTWKREAFQYGWHTNESTTWNWTSVGFCRPQVVSWSAFLAYPAQESREWEAGKLIKLLFAGLSLWFNRTNSHMLTNFVTLLSSLATCLFVYFVCLILFWLFFFPVPSATWLHPLEVQTDNTSERSSFNPEGKVRSEPSTSRSLSMSPGFPRKSNLCKDSGNLLQLGSNENHCRKTSFANLGAKSQHLGFGWSCVQKSRFAMMQEERHDPSFGQTSFLKSDVAKLVAESSHPGFGWSSLQRSSFPRNLANLLHLRSDYPLDQRSVCASLVAKSLLLNCDHKGGQKSMFARMAVDWLVHHSS